MSRSNIVCNWAVHHSMDKHTKLKCKYISLPTLVQLYKHLIFTSHFSFSLYIIVQKKKSKKKESRSGKTNVSNAKCKTLFINFGLYSYFNVYMS